MAPKPGEPTSDGAGWRALVVDDSIVVRAAVRAMLAAIPEIATIESAGSASVALGILEARAETQPIDVVFLDVEMPAMTGIEALPHVLRVSPSSRVVMASSLTRRGAAVTMAALAAGAADYICKPQAAEALARQGFAAELATKVAIWGADARRARRAVLARPPRAASPAFAAEADRPSSAGPRPLPRPSDRYEPGRHGAGPGAGHAPVNRPGHRDRQAHCALQQNSTSPTASAPIEALAIGSSTGGPQALLQLFAALQAPYSCPIFVTQHMPPAFTAMLAEQIGRLAGATCREAQDGEPVARGRIYVAPGDHHLEVEGEPGRADRIRLSRAAPENFCRPSVDPMLRSLAPIYRGGLSAIILTGMGQDGSAGARSVKLHGGRILVQDEASSVVWGMPGAIVRSGLADHVLPVPEMAAVLRPSTCRQLAGVV